MPITTVQAQSVEALIDDHKTPGDVLVYGMGYSAQRYSPLTRINKGNVKRLVPMWTYSMNDQRGAEAFPIIDDGVIYTTAHNATIALDAMTGKHLWRHWNVSAAGEKGTETRGGPAPLTRGQFGGRFAAESKEMRCVPSSTHG